MLRSVVFFVVGSSVAADADSNSLLQGFKQQGKHMFSAESSGRKSDDDDDDDGKGKKGDDDDDDDGKEPGKKEQDKKEKFIRKVKCPAFKVMIQNDMLDTDDAAHLTTTNLVPALEQLGAGFVMKMIFNKTLKFHLTALGRDPDTGGLDISAVSDETPQGYIQEQAFSTGITDQNNDPQFNSSRFHEIFGSDPDVNVSLDNLDIASIKAQHDIDVLDGLDTKGFGTASPLIQYAALFDLYGIGEQKQMLQSELQDLLKDGTIPDRLQGNFEVPNPFGFPATDMVMKALKRESQFQFTRPEFQSGEFQKLYKDLGYCHDIDPIPQLLPDGVKCPERT